MRYLLFSFLVLSWCQVSFSKTVNVNVNELVKRAEYNLRGKSYQGEALMTVHRSDGQRELKFKFFMLGDSATLIRILEPKKDKGITSLRKGFDLWQFLPKVNRVVRVPSSLMLQSWMGSDFSNDDVVKASSWVRDYTASLSDVGSASKPGLVNIDLLPRKGAPIVWGKIRLTLRESDAAFLKQEFYKEDGTLVKTLLASKHIYQNKRTFPLHYQMKNNEMAEALTEINFESSKIKVDQVIAKSLFSESKMRDTSW